MGGRKIGRTLRRADGTKDEMTTFGRMARRKDGQKEGKTDGGTEGL